ncbi:MAG TPA: hypothetical protein VGX25_24680 [Actinophytocola sp.]|uniref:hypothetical protein n=1 Tax=Actinophytocola sp. TaxID=1872138 RepID=UPI002DDCB860|nr:hypothetical protein [Actinophytocola sp.]HEV2782600.1 hypothetical protein [Actinophytocola sp.]
MNPEPPIVNDPTQAEPAMTAGDYLGCGPFERDSPRTYTDGPPLTEGHILYGPDNRKGRLSRLGLGGRPHGWSQFPFFSELAQHPPTEEGVRQVLTTWDIDLGGQPAT